jgi:hypothetical protein
MVLRVESTWLYLAGCRGALPEAVEAYLERARAAGHPVVFATLGSMLGTVIAPGEEANRCGTIDHSNYVFCLFARNIL